jgi:hypothetical protein
VRSTHGWLCLQIYVEHCLTVTWETSCLSVPLYFQYLNILLLSMKYLSPFILSLSLTREMAFCGAPFYLHAGVPRCSCCSGTLHSGSLHILLFIHSGGVMLSDACSAFDVSTFIRACIALHSPVFLLLFIHMFFISWWRLSILLHCCLMVCASWSIPTSTQEAFDARECRLPFILCCSCGDPECDHSLILFDFLIQYDIHWYSSTDAAINDDDEVWSDVLKFRRLIWYLYSIVASQQTEANTILQ